MNILLVDDKQTLLNSIERFLAGLGHHVNVALNGLDGFEQTHKNQYDLFIVDHLMPVMDGIQLVKRLKRQAKTSLSPIILMSTQDITTLTHLTKNKLVEHIISKPIDFELLANILTQYNDEKTVHLSL